MKPLSPPRLAVYVLRRFLAHNEPLAGDLLEEFERRRSRVWLWSQVIAAVIVNGRRRGEVEIRPLHLVEERLTPLRMLDSDRLRPIVNLTASPVHGTGGLGIVSLLLLSTALEPGMWWFFVLSLLAGIGVGWARISRARRHGLPGTASLNHVFTGR
jgi:hypothetical protein